jgi:viroplasmin and RNaseH domain-containing protein
MENGFIIWDDYTGELYASFGSRQEAEVYLDELVEQGLQRSDFSIITQEEYKSYLEE